MHVFPVPGVNILSALAYDEADQPSSSAYGKMSGTSMASPYCSAAHILFRLVRPGYTGVEAVECMLASNAKTDDGTPMLRLTQALAACPEPLIGNQELKGRDEHENASAGQHDFLRPVHRRLGPCHGIGTRRF